MQDSARVRLHEGAAFWLCRTFDIEHDSFAAHWIERIYIQR